MEPGQVNDDEGLPPLVLNDAVLASLLWDLLPHEDVTPAHYEALNLRPADGDIQDMEHEASHTRREQLGSIEPLVTTVASMAGNVITQAILLKAATQLEPGEDFSDEEKEKVLETVSANVVAGSLAVIVELVDMGVLNVGGVAWYE
jgi:hypothetical protein